MPPIDITFHFPTPTLPSQGSSRRLIATNSRLFSTGSAPIYITVDKTKRKSKPHRTTAAIVSPPSPPGTAESSSSSAPTTSTTATISLSKRRKGPVHVYPTQTSSKIKTASLTPLLRPIVARCSASSSSQTLDDHPLSALPSPPRKRFSAGSANGQKGKSTGGTQSVWPLIHPYSRSTDLANTRSSVPSPREVARAQRVEEEKARAKKESAALARAAVAAKRKPKTKAQTRGGSRFPSASVGPRRARSDSPATPTSPEKGEKDYGVPVITTEPASQESSPLAAPTPNFPSSRPLSGLKRTRSQGVLPISTALGANSVSVSSPLKAVMGFSQDEGEDDDTEPGRSRKRTRLADGISVGDDANTSSGGRRANTHSPIGTPPALPDDHPHAQVPHTFPLPAAKVLPRQNGRAASIAPSSFANPDEIGGATNMRRVVSAGIGRRTGSFSSDGSGRERSRREVNLPNRLRDYDMRAGGAVI